jgi:pyruvate-formate lyase
MTDPAIFSFARAYAEAQRQGLTPDEALGCGVRADYASRAPSVAAENLLAGMPGSTSLVQLDLNGLSCAGSLPECLLGTEEEDEARAALADWQPRTTAAVFSRSLAAECTQEELHTLQEPSLGWGGGWGGHAILGYEEVLASGVPGLRQRVQAALETAAQAGADPATLGWFRGLLHACDGIIRFIGNHARRAQALADEAATPDEQAHYRAIADCCAHLTQGGARSLREAVQLFWFIHLLDNTDSPGRIDQFLLPYYQQLPGDAAARYAAAWPVLEALWGKFIACRSWNVCLGGQTADGADATNDLTYLFLDLQVHSRREAPNLSVRLFGGSPPRLLERCVEVIGTGAGLPALYNDETLVPALCALGIPVHEARNYAMNGCAQVDIQGMSHMGLEDGELNLAKCLELALHAGVSPITGLQVGAPTLPAAEITDFATLLAQLYRQIDHCAGVCIHSANLFQRVIAATAPHLLRSLFIADCLAQGVDMKRGGARYNHGQFLTQGIANTADALYAIRRLVFEEARVTLAALVEILDADWAGQEALRAEVLERFPKYGNQHPEVDALAAEVVGHYFALLPTQRTWRGGRYSGGVIVFNRAPGYGQGLAAGADGRLRGQPVADSCGPMTGRDRTGPTAMLHSTAALPHHLATSAMCLNLKFNPAHFATEAGRRQIAALIAGYFDLGGQQLQINVVDAATLRAARQTPHDYRHVVVRVGGYSARFVELADAQQDEIIARTAH